MCVCERKERKKEKERVREKERERERKKERKRERERERERREEGVVYVCVYDKETWSGNIHWGIGNDEDHGQYFLFSPYSR